MAKVTRDRLMVAMHLEDPRYGYAHHKGYATAEHLAAIRQYGRTDAHRRTFRPPTLLDLLTDATTAADEHS